MPFESFPGSIIAAQKRLSQTPVEAVEALRQGIFSTVFKPEVLIVRRMIRDVVSENISRQ